MGFNSIRVMTMKNKRKITIGSILVVICLFSIIPIPLSAETSWYDTDWRYRKLITIDADKVAGDLTDFPVLISLTDSDLADYAQNFGEDIFFTTSEGTKLSHEIESFNGYTGELYAWVKIPSLSSTTDTKIYMYFGNSDCSSQEDVTGTWSNGYVAVYHMNDATTSTILDSTSNDNDGTKKGANEPIEATAKIYKGQDFDGTDDYVDCGNDTSLDITDEITMDVWVKMRGTQSTWAGIVSKGQNTGSYCLFVNKDTTKIAFRLNGTSATDLYSGDLGTDWNHVIATYNKNSGIYNQKLYINGVEIRHRTDTLTISISDLDLLIGNTEVGTRYFNGTIDEVRISNVARSAEWIETEYNNMNDPSSFYSVGSEVSWSTPTVAITFPNANYYAGNESIDISWNWNYSGGDDVNNFTYVSLYYSLDGGNDNYTGVIAENVTSSDPNILSWTDSGGSYRWDFLSFDSYYTGFRVKIVASYKVGQLVDDVEDVSDGNNYIGVGGSNPIPFSTLPPASPSLPVSITPLPSHLPPGVTPSNFYLMYKGKHVRFPSTIYELFQTTTWLKYDLFITRDVSLKVWVFIFLLVIFILTIFFWRGGKKKAVNVYVYVKGEASRRKEEYKDIMDRIYKQYK